MTCLLLRWVGQNWNFYGSLWIRAEHLVCQQFLARLRCHQVLARGLRGRLSLARWQGGSVSFKLFVKSAFSGPWSEAGKGTSPRGCFRREERSQKKTSWLHLQTNPRLSETWALGLVALSDSCVATIAFVGGGGCAKLESSGLGYVVTRRLCSVQGKRRVSPGLGGVSGEKRGSPVTRGLCTDYLQARRRPRAPWLFVRKAESLTALQDVGELASRTAGLESLPCLQRVRGCVQQRWGSCPSVGRNQ